jgi:hypothetical protein
MDIESTVRVHEDFMVPSAIRIRCHNKITSARRPSTSSRTSAKSSEATWQPRSAIECSGYTVKGRVVVVAVEYGIRDYVDRGRNRLRER